MPKMFDGEYSPHTISLRKDHKIFLLRTGRGSITCGVRLLLERHFDVLDAEHKKALIKKVKEDSKKKEKKK
jgi:hypothetical protein